MSELQGNTEIKMGSDRSFGLVFAVVFLLIALWPVLHGNTPRFWSMAVVAIFLGLALVSPDLLHPLNRLWFRFGLLLNKIVSPIVMGILFFFTVTPISLIRRIRNRDPLNQKLDPSAKSYWIMMDDEAPPKTSMRKQF